MWGLLLAGDEEDQAVGDRDGVVGVALVIAAEQRDVDRGLDAVGAVLRQQGFEDGAVQVVDGVVVSFQTPGGGDVLAFDELSDLSGQPGSAQSG
jgi:hypothetical protein